MELGGQSLETQLPRCRSGDPNCRVLNEPSVKVCTGRNCPLLNPLVFVLKSFISFTIDVFSASDFQSNARHVTFHAKHIDLRFGNRVKKWRKKKIITWNYTKQTVMGIEKKKPVDKFVFTSFETFAGGEVHPPGPFPVPSVDSRQERCTRLRTTKIQAYFFIFFCIIMYAGVCAEEN